MPSIHALFLLWFYFIFLYNHANKIHSVFPSDQVQQTGPHCILLATNPCQAFHPAHSSSMKLQVTVTGFI